MAPFKLENVVIIAPGSRYVNAQMGIGETPTPPRFRFPSRMFPTDQPDRFEPVKIHVRKRVKLQPGKSQEQENGLPNGTAINGTTNGEQTAPADTEMTDAASQANGTAPMNADGTQGTATAMEMAEPTGEEEEEFFEEDPESDEGAIWPIQQGRIEHFPCFAALMTHAYQSVNPNFNSPVCIVAQPSWTVRDLENITRLVFQQWTSPALNIADAAMMGPWGIGAQHCVVVDVGYEKCDITPIYDFLVDHPARRIGLEHCGGRAMTQKLQQLLKKQGFTEDMAEQLKKSGICEILLPGSALPGKSTSNGNVSNPAAAASTGATASGANAKEADGIRPGQVPRGPGLGTEVGQAEDEEKEGILDIASIVARDNAAELLAKREAEKAAKVAAKKGGAQEAPKQVRLKNSERDTATFTYKEAIPSDDSNGNGTTKTRVRKREIEVGVERFMAAEPLAGEYEGILETIASNIHSSIMAHQNLHARSALWDNILVCGNGSRVKGFKEALLAMLIQRYRLSPSTATMFTSELPSNFTTPVATPGTNTPIPGQGGHLHHPAGHGVNPLLLAATRNVMQPNPGHHLQIPGHATPVIDPVIRGERPISQTPLSIKYCKLPEYMPDFKSAKHIGLEDASFAGAQVLGAQVWTNRDESAKMYLLRSEFNEEGPPGIAQYCTGWIG